MIDAKKKRGGGLNVPLRLDGREIRPEHGGLWIAIREIDSPDTGTGCNIENIVQRPVVYGSESQSAVEQQAEHGMLEIQAVLFLLVVRCMVLASLVRMIRSPVLLYVRVQRLVQSRGGSGIGQDIQGRIGVPSIF